MSVLFLVIEYFRIQRNLFNSLKPKILCLQKINYLINSKATTSRTSLT